MSGAIDTVQEIWTGRLDHKVSKQRERRRRSTHLSFLADSSFPRHNGRNAFARIEERVERRSASDFRHWRSMKTAGGDRKGEQFRGRRLCSRAVIFAVDVYQHSERCARYFKIATAGAAERP